MDSNQIKEMLDEWYFELKMDLLEDEFDEDDPEFEINKNYIEKSIGKWIRVSKNKNSNGDYQRIFENKITKEKVLVIEDNILGFTAEGKYVFHIFSSNRIVISDLNYFNKNGYCSDWHLSHLVATPDFLTEQQESVFSSKKDVTFTRQTLIDLGFIEDNNFSKFVSKNMNS